MVFARYSYDRSGNLVAASDADGHTTRFTYDEDHRLTHLEYPSGLVFRFIYDGSGRCVETWGEYPGRKDPALAEGLPELLRDNRTRAKGIYQCRFEYGDGYTEVVDSIRLQRFFAGPGDTVAKAVDARGGVTDREYDRLGRVVRQADPTRATWHYEYDAIDNVVREIDPMGNVIEIKRDTAGREIELVDADGGVVTIARSLSGEVAWIRDQRGAVKQFARGSGGFVTEAIDERGGRHIFEHDAHGNCVAHTTPTGARFQFVYDDWGRLIGETDPLGATRRYRYSNSGRVTAIADALGRWTTFEYDSMGNLIRETGPDGASVVWEYGGLNWLYCQRHPDGTEVRTAWNREGWRVHLLNEHGEKCEFTYDLTGDVVAERDFHGKTTRYGRDAMGRTRWFDEGHGKHQYTLTPIGQVIKEEAPDGSVRTYEYNLRGELVRAQADEVSFAWTRDAAGNVIREELNIGGAKCVVESSRGVDGHRHHVRTSLGHELQVRRDGSGRVAELWSGADRIVAITRDPLGSVVRRDFSRGGAVLDTYDAARRLRRRELLSPGQIPAGQPAWVGRGGPRTRDALYDYTPADEILKITYSDGADIDLEYDVRGRLKARRQGTSVETFVADAADNYYEVGPSAPPRRYGPGNQLLRRAEFEYKYDDRGFLVEKHRRAPDSTAPEVTRFEWNSWGLESHGEHTRLEEDQTRSRASQERALHGEEVYRPRSGRGRERLRLPV